MQAQKMSPIWYWVSPIYSDLVRFGPSVNTATVVIRTNAAVNTAAENE